MTTTVTITMTTTTTTTATITATTTATTTRNACQIEGSTSRNDSLFSTPTLSRHTEQSIGRVLYVDKSALSQYQRDDYLLIDPFRSHSDLREWAKGFPDLMCTRDGPIICDRVDLGDSAPVLGNQFTLEARFYYEDDGDGRGQLLGSESFRAPAISFHNHGKEIRYGFWTDGAVSGYPGRATKLNTQKAWHHVATTFDGTNYKLFLDGVEIDNSTAFQGLTPPEIPVRIIGKKPWVGKIDEVRMWSVARTQDEIQANMNKTLVGNETGLVAYYPMDVNNNWEIIDKSPNANHAKITNAEILSRYFSDNSSCTNGPDGTTSCPYPTIRSALDNVTSGDHVYIRQGRYTELLNIRLFNVDQNKGQDLEDAFLKEEEKIVIEAYPNEEVIIDGTVALNDNSSNWEQYSHQLDNGTTINIFKTVIDFDNITREIMKPVDNITQVFVNGRYMIPAMPMNFKNPTDPTTGNPNNPEPGTVWAGIGRSPFSYSANDTFAMLQSGLDAGAYNLDKVNDLVKEMGISLTDGRFVKNADMFSKSTQDLFKKWQEGGASQKDVINSMIQDFGKMDGQYEQLNRAGTVWSALGEDNSMKVIQALGKTGTAYDDVAGAAKKATDNSVTDVEKMKGAFEDLKVGLAPIGEAIAKALLPFIEGLKSLGDKFKKLSPGMKSFISQALIIGAVVGKLVAVIAMA